MTVRFSHVIAACSVIILLGQGASAEVFLPGMQPKEADIEFVKVQQCRMCHGGTDNGQADPFLSWQSDCAKRGREGTCQSCHYREVKGGGQASRFGDLKRDYFVMHGPVGGSTWIQDATFLLWKGRDLDRRALDLSKQRARLLLEEAASLEISLARPGYAALKVTNETGHKLPSGYEEGRRMWVSAVFMDSSGNVIREIGKYGDKQDSIFGEPVRATTLLDPDQTRVYEVLFGISEARARKFGTSPGKSFHSVLNDYLIKDNRIPPEGFDNARFAEHLSEPVGATYADGQHWDEFEMELPKGCKKVVVKLMYESMSWEYLKFLADENKTDDWGRRLYDAWTKTGRCEPTVMAIIEKSL